MARSLSSIYMPDYIWRPIEPLSDTDRRIDLAAFSKLESYDDSEDRESVDEKFFVCSVEPFVFTHQTDASEVADAFSRWLDQGLAVSVKEYGDRL